MAEVVEPLQRKFRAVLRQLFLRRIGREDFAEAKTGRAAEHHQVDKAVGAEAIGAMNRHASRFANRKKAGDDASGTPSFRVTTSP